MSTENPEKCEQLSRLSDRRLHRESAYIDGAWCGAQSRETRVVRNASTDRVLGTIPLLSVEETRTAIEAAARAFPPWRALLPQQRSGLLRRWFELIVENKEDLALLMTLEQGKPLADSRGEIDYAAGFVEWNAEEAKRVNVEGISPHLPNRTMIVRREPLGVIALVTPWNFPTAMITRKTAAALAAGCTAVIRPALETPFSATALAELAERAGVPAGVLNIVTGDAETIVGELCHSPTVRGLSFTGSTEVGRLLLRQCADTVKRTVMELGGHAPFIAFPDMDLERAVAGAMAAKFATTGQDCLAANRIFVHRNMYEPFIERFSAAVSEQKVGDGLDPDVVLGPLMHERAMAKCEAHVADALAKGARLTTGGKRHALGHLFFEPTVLADITPRMNIYREETFGPVAGLMPFDDEEDVVAMANDTPYGLIAYLYTADLGRAHRLSEVLEYGMVAVNTAKVTGAPIPFGGVKQSGIGREGSRHGLEAFTELKYVCIER
jgi:succinate-semialdehyde dehydrogenase